MTKYFYIRITKKNERESGFWYNEFVGYVFLVKNNPKNRKNYVVADGCGWIEKKDSERIEIETWNPL